MARDETKRERDARRKEIGGGVRVKATERRTKWEMEGVGRSLIGRN